MGWAVAVVAIGLGRKTEVARGGWAEDARRPPATSLVSVVIPLLGAWGRVAAFDTKLRHGGDWNLKRIEELSRLDAECPSEAQDIHEGDVPLTPFDATDIIPVQVC